MAQTIDYMFRFHIVRVNTKDCSSTIYNWKCDYVNNKIETSINLHDTNNLNKTIKKYRTKFPVFTYYDIRFSEHNGKIYLHIITRRGYSIFTYCLIELIKDSYVIKYSNNYVNSTFLVYASRYGFPDDYLECTEKYIKSDITIESITDFPSSLRYGLKGKINENKYYEIAQNYLQIHTVDCLLGTKTSIIKLDDKIENIETLKNKVYMILSNNSLCIYDAETGLIQNEYSYDSETVIEKYSDFLVFRQPNQITCQIFSLKPEIIKMKYYDIMFDFK